jgi:hypothetical protein
MKIEEEYQDVLQNLEFSIVSIYRNSPDLIDAEVLKAIASLVRIYGAEAQGKSISNRPLRGITKEVAEAVQAMGEIRLGRSSMDHKDGQVINITEPISVDILVACLKRIESSIKFWTRERGRQGYLNYIQNFMP